MSQNPYETLRVPEDASPDDIRKAYKREAHAAHPDRDGGDTERFQMVSAARDVLSDPDRRARYDRTGQTDVPQVSPAEEKLAELFNRVVNEQKFDGDIMATCRNATHAAISQMAMEKAGANKKLAKFNKQLGRIKSKGKMNIYENIIKERIHNLTMSLEQVVQNEAIAREVLTLLDEYEDTAPEDSPVSPWVHTATGSRTQW